MTAWKYQSDWKNKLGAETLIVQKCGVFNICKPLTTLFWHIEVAAVWLEKDMKDSNIRKSAF